VAELTESQSCSDQIRDLNPEAAMFDRVGGVPGGKYQTASSVLELLGPATANGVGEKATSPATSRRMAQATSLE
jgi:hypothetical protein